ncbi:MAG TPA: cyclophilin-like fold protein [Candidatus Deferrimicrobium sp.]|nr:cyclophilin-like fold protein [Candidatus Deferrimicrobium sp.]
MLNIFPIQITIIGKEEIIEGQLVRTNAPRTVEKILTKLPITGRAAKQGNQVNLTIGINMGKEKATKLAKKGEIGYWIMGDAISIFLEDTEPYGEINVIGNITLNLEKLKDLRLGTSLKLDRK